MPEKGMIATAAGSVRPISGTWMRIPGTSPPILGGDGDSFGKWAFYAVPEVQVTKEANYSDIQILGRSSPIKTYAGSGYRRLATTFHLHSTNPQLKRYHIAFVRALESLLYPEYKGTYLPPPIAQFRCGVLISNRALVDNGMGGYVNVVATSINYSLDPNIVMLGVNDLFPVYLSIQVNFDVVYQFNLLPGASDVVRGAH
jgi:hypothetical protein